MSDIEIEIDGKPLKAKANSMVIQVADDAGIYIPRFCYHKHLSIAANCRMCLVEVEKAPKPMPACATPVMPGMKVFTKSPKALAAQKAVMEFLLINHPLDCPICDQGGECELQDLSMGFGASDSKYNEGKRAVKDKDIGPLIATEMTRCIHCTRCVRFGNEVAGLPEMGATGRGENTEIGTYIEKSIQSEVSGNVIDLCPVGALTSKPFRFTARAWELNQYPTIAPHDCVGSNIYAHTRRSEVMRVVPRENANINETWISDRDRFSYEALSHHDRLAKPMIRRDGHWEETDWQTALEFAVNGLQQVVQQNGPEQLGALASPNSTLEEFYLLQKLMRQLGHSNVDHRLRQVDFSDQEHMPVFPGLNGNLNDIEEADVILLVGSNIQKEQPMASLRVRKAALKGARVMAVNMVDYQFHFPTHATKIAAPQQLPHALAGIAKALGVKHASVNSAVADDTIANVLRDAKKAVVLMGVQAFQHTDAAALRALSTLIAKECHATLGFLTEGANAAGAWIAGAVPHRETGGVKATSAGLHAKAMLEQPRKAYVLLNVEPDLDFANPALALAAMEQAEFVVSLSLFKNPMLNQYANVILPIAAFTETSGTFVNASYTWQNFAGVAEPFGEARPAWKVLRVLGNLLNCDGFDYTSTEDIVQEIKSRITNMPTVEMNTTHFNMPIAKSGMHRIGEVPIYSGDSLVRRAKALQATQPVIEGNVASVRLNPTTATSLRVDMGDVVWVKQGDRRARLPVILDARIPAEAALVAGGIVAASELGELFGSIEIMKA